MVVCQSCGKENPDEARFCLACGTPMAAPEPAVGPAEERKLITVLFVDVVGSTARAEQLDPEDVRSMLAPYHARARAKLESFGGRVEKFVGDAVLALFGAPVAHEDDPERAVRAAFAIREAIAELNAKDAWLDLHIRVGVHTGEALVMLDARPDQGDWTAAGDVMNTAARLQSAAPTDGILVGELTYRATHEAIEYRDHEPIEAKGKAEPVPVWEAVGVRQRESAAPRAGAPLIGRTQELEQVWELWEQIEKARRPGLATLLGPPGIGKSRLLAELAGRLGERCDVHWGRCLSYGEGITYWPVVEILKHAAGITHDDDESAVSDKLGALLAGLGTSDRDQLRTMAAALANLIGVATTPEGTYSAAEIGQAELHWGIRRVLELLSARRPLVLVLEDLHWAEPTLLDLIEFLGESGAEAPFLLLCSARPEAREARPTLFVSDSSRRTVELEALSADESEALLAGLLREEGLPPGAAARLLENAGGNPLFLEETARMLSDAGELDEGEVEKLPVPTSLQALIGSRLDQLPASSKRIAQQASVIGSVFWPGAVVHLGANGDLAPGLSDLERRDLIRANVSSSVAGEDEYVFKHVLIREVAYGRVPKGERARLHSRFAEWTQALPGGEDELVEIVAYHLEQACLIARTIARHEEPPPFDLAVAALARAAAKAERREGFREAERFYSRALELADAVEVGTRADLRYRRSLMLVGRGALGQARDELVEVLDAALSVGRLELRCAALLTLANLEWKQGHAREQRDLLAEAHSIAEAIGDRRLGIMTAFELANLRGWFEGEAGEAVEDLRDALARAEEFGDRALLTEAHLRLGTALINMGELAEAEERFTSALELAGEDGSHRDEARATTLLGFVKYYRGEPAVAEQLAAQALEWLERTGDTDLQIQNFRSLARYAIARGDFEQAERRLRAVLPLALELGGWLATDIYRYLAEAIVRQGRLDDANELVAFAARSVPKEDHYARASLLVAEAIVATEAGEPTAAATAFAEALRLMEAQELQLDLGEARIELARSLRSFGDVGAARTELERARVMFARMDARAVVAEIDRELEELAEGADAAGPLR
ncbi:MAG: AAA family ATPase [Actinomycetota bacterium]|nr:AAA family ATPase [Actinomycetota bacterium]